MRKITVSAAIPILFAAFVVWFLSAKSYKDPDAVEIIGTNTIACGVSVPYRPISTQKVTEDYEQIRQDLMTAQQESDDRMCEVLHLADNMMTRLDAAIESAKNALADSSAYNSKAG